MASVPPLIVTGMARSGTSAATRLLQSAGLDVGDELIPANDDNQVGFYEDISFVEFNQEVMAAGLAAEPELRPRWMYAERIDSELLEPLGGRAREMVAARGALGHPWGFKDPRTAALLDFWDAAAPGARYLFVYRPPWDVVDSMFRLSRRPLVGRADLAARTWVTYNRAILGFMARNRERCVLVHAAALAGAGSEVVARASALLREAGAGELGAPARDAVDPSLLVSLPPGSALAEVVRAGFPETEEVYAELERAADLPAAAAAAEPAAVAPVRMAANGSSGELPIDLVVVGGEAPGVARREVVVAPEPSAGAAANAGLAATEADVVAVAFGAVPRAEPLAAAAAAVEGREGRAAAIGGGVLSEGGPGTIYPGELLEETFRPRTIVLRRSTWRELGGFDEALPAAGLDAWAAAVALVDAGVPVVPVVDEGGAGAGAVPAGAPAGAADAAALPGAADHARRHVAARHAELFARHAAHLRRRAEDRIADLEGQRDRALELRDQHEAAAADAQRRVEDAERRAARGAELANHEAARAAAAEERIAAAERRAAEAEGRAGRAEALAAERDALAAQLEGLRATRLHRLGRVWWRLRHRTRGR